MRRVLLPPGQETGAYQPETIEAARQRYFEQGLAPAQLIGAPLLRSWERCRRYGHDFRQSLSFEPVERGELSLLMQSERSLLRSAQPAIDSLARALAPAGYAIMLTNQTGRVVSVGGDLPRLSRPTQCAFRLGVDVSERVVGTTAMSVALAEHSAHRVRGGEHYFAFNQLFHCFATPLFNLRGQLLGSLDVTRDVPELAQCAIDLTQRCAADIEWNLLHALPAFLKVQLDGIADAWMAFDGDGRVLGASSAARRLLGLCDLPDDLGFHDLCEDRFATWVSALRRKLPRAARIRLRAGVELLTSALGETPPRLVGGSAAPMSRDVPASLPGDTTLRAEMDRAQRALDAGVPVLVQGETGVGKEVAARVLHRLSKRWCGPWIAVNCGAIAPELVASELFGHAEGAFTGSLRGGRAGVFEAAHGGCVFLDEIGDMPQHLQVALLRVLDHSEVLRVGSTRAVEVDVAVVCASHHDLETLVRQGTFRKDLYYRLKGYTLRVPPLRERDDFDAVVDSVLHELGADPDCLGPALRERLRAQPWPGNVRELRQTLRVALALAPDPRLLRAEDLRLPSPACEDAPNIQAPFAGLPLREQERRAIDEALARSGGDVARAAATLGISRATLYRRLQARRAP